MTSKIHNQSQSCENRKLCDWVLVKTCPGPSWTQPRRWRWHILLPAMAWLTFFSFMFYVRSWPTCSPLTSIHIISHNCHSPSLLLDSGKHPWPPASMFSELLNPPPPSFHSAVSQSQPSDHMLCAVSAAERCSYLLGAHTLGPSWMTGILVTSLAALVGMRGCFRTERHALLLCHSSGRLQACRPRGTRLHNVFILLKGTTHQNAWKDSAVPSETRGINETLISFLIEPLLIYSESLKNLGQTLCNP